MMIDWPILLMALVTDTSVSGWESTRWGMGPTEVTAVVPGATIQPPGRSRYASQARVQSTHKMQGRSYSAAFVFDEADRLTSVRLTLRDASGCEMLYGELLTRYGSPIEANRPFRNDAWADPQSGNRVTIIDARHDPNVRSCVIIYAPLHREGLINRY